MALNKTVRIVFNKQQLLKAVRFVWEHNFRIKSGSLNIKNIAELYNYVYDSLIVKTVKENVSNPDNWSSWVSTAGFLIMFTTDDVDVIKSVHVDIYVDPSIGSEMITSYNQETIVL